MHRALKIPEVLDLICLHISPDRDREPSINASRALARLAQTYTTLSEPALDTLWSFQNTVVHILDCMPTGFWSKIDRSLRRPILRTDWERPLFYTHRVRRISCTDTSFPPALNLSEVFEMLRFSLPTQHLLPNLRSLTWLFNKTSDSSLPHALLLFSPRITQIVLGRFKSRTHLTLLSALGGKCPALTDVRLIQAEIQDASESQTLGTPHIFDTAIPAPILPVPKFIALQYLELKSASSQCMLTFVRNMSHYPLASLLINLSPPPDFASTVDIYVALEKYLPSTSLTLLSMTSNPASTPPGFWIDQPPLQIDEICHLFHFPNLTSVTLRPPTGFDLDDEDILALSEAWPRVVDLSLGSCHLPRTTLRSLVFLAQHCLFLNTLELSLDASIIPEMDQSLPKRIRQFSLVEWEVADSVLASSLLVARFLSGVFPSLDGIRTNMQDEENHDDGAAGVLKSRWMEVEVALPVCHEMRYEERYWAQKACYRSRSLSREL
ncbi:hypothetical protein B0H17DRAFT_1211477 [Mycena rosella]|uniref:F-box domain-containing protein n=1 Tax=Mycena rosella TaxID=1033263 RepID=A0AAD7G7N8_MYCRO|nr:hypothetical protein B0H17DRAFT_1211477 [Mycena rosella]